MRFSEMNDTDLQYAAINDKVSRQALIGGLETRDLILKGDRDFDDGKTDEEKIDSYYSTNKSLAVKTFKLIEDKIGRHLTDEEMVNIYDIMDVTSYSYYLAQRVTSETTDTDSYDEEDGGRFLREIEYIVKAIEYGILDEVHDRVMDKVQDDPNYIIDDYHKNWGFDKNVVTAFNDIMEEKYGTPTKKAEDELPKEEEPLPHEDLLNLEDFEDIYED